MANDKTAGAAWITAGAVTGAGIASNGGIGVLVAGTGFGVGTSVMVGAGAVVGSAAYGAYQGICEADPLALGALGTGLAMGAGTYSLVGGVGIAGQFGAIGLGLGGLTAIGGVVGLGIYGLGKLLDSGYRESPFDVFSRMEDKILWQEAYTHALIELTFREDDLIQQFRQLDVESELTRLKAELVRRKRWHEKTAFKRSRDRFNLDSPQSPQSVNALWEPGTDRSSQSPSVWMCDDWIEHHDGRVNAIAISPDGSTVVTGSDDRTVTLWDLRTGNRLYTLGQAQPVLALAISSDGKTLVSAGADQTVTGWNVNTRNLLYSFLPYASPYSHAGWVHSVAFASASNILVSGSADKTIRVWKCDQDLGDKLKRTLTGHTDQVCSVAISADGKRVVSGSADQTIRVWDLTTWHPPRILLGHTDWVTTVAVSPGQQWIASGSRDSTVRLWDFQTGQLLQTLNAHTDWVISVIFSPDGKTLVSSGRDGTIRFWQLTDLDSPQVSSGAVLPGTGPIAFSPDGRTLVSGDKGGALKIWCYQ